MKISTRQIALAGILSAVTLAISAIGVGFIPIPSLAGAATIMHVPVIVAGGISGVLVGGFTGLIFGFFSFIQFGSIVGSNPVILFLPRILIGVVAAVVFRSLSKKNLILAGALAGAAGTLTNTIGVLGLAMAFGYFTPSQVLGIMAANLPLELFLGTASGALILPPLYRFMAKSRGA